MSLATYSAGRAAADTLVRLEAMHRAATQLRPVDRINIAAEAADEALGILGFNGDDARDLLIAAAANLIRAAEMLEPQLNGLPVPTKVAA